MNPELQEFEQRLVAQLADFRQEMYSLLSKHEERIQERIQELREQFAALLADQIGSLHVQMQRMEERLLARSELHSARLDKHAGLLGAGTRWMTRMTEWSEGKDATVEIHLQRINACEKRLEALESRH